MSERVKGATGVALPVAPLLRLDPGMHTAPVRRIDIDAAGRFLVTGSHDKTVRVWSVDDGALLRTLRVPIGDGDVGKINAVAISPDGHQVAAGGSGPGSSGDDQSVYVFARATGRLVGRVDGLPNVVNHLAFSPDGRYLVAPLGGANGIRVFESELFTEVARDPDYGDHSLWAAFDPAGNLATTSYDGRLRLYDTGFGLIRSVAAAGGTRPLGIAFAPDGARVAVGYDDTTRVDVLDGRTLEPLFAAETGGVDGLDLSKVAWSGDGRALYAGGRVAGKKLRRWAEGGRGAYQDLALSQNTIMDLRPLGEGELAFGAADPAIGVLGSDGTVLWRHGPAQADFRDQEKALAVSEDGTSLAFGFEQWGAAPARFDLAARRLTLDPEPDPSLATARTEGLPVEGWKNDDDPTLDGARLPLKPLETSCSLAVAPDDERFLLGTGWNLRLFDGTGEEIWEVPAPGTAWAVVITGDGRLALAALGDGTIRWYRLEDGRELLAFFPHGDRERWVAWTPEGYYMASPGGEELIGWHVNRGPDRAPEFYGAARFRDQFHKPDVVALVLDELDVRRAVARAARESDVEPAARTDLENILPPVIEIIEPADGTAVEGEDCIVTYWLESPAGDPVRRVKALLDGRVVTENPEPPFSGRMIVPLSGEDATLTLIAEGTRASDPATVRLRWRGAVIGERVKPVLWVLAVGINHYKKYDHLKLNYAVQDAIDFVKTVRRQAGGLYRSVEFQRLLNEEASGDDVVTALDWLERSLNARDVGLVFLAGHGANDGRGEFHFLPHDVDLSNDVRLRRSAIGHHEIRSVLKSLAERGKALMFLDACHSGNVMGGRDLPPDIDTVASDLAQAENGVIVFTSSTGRELSREDPAWENGAFTEALLEALAGKAAGADGYISIHGLQGYLPKRVRALTGDAQNPQVYVPDGRVRDFKLALVR